MQYDRPELALIIPFGSSERMVDDLNKVEALFADQKGPEFRILTVRFEIEDIRDALEVGREIALLEGTELIYWSHC